jgi:hypothetical protein
MKINKIFIEVYRWSFVVQNIFTNGANSGQTVVATALTITGARGLTTCS